MSSQQLKVVVGLGPVSTEIVQPILGEDITFIENPTADDLKIAVGAIVRAAYIVDKAAMDAMPELKVIARTGVGYDLVDIAEADARGIPVVITPGSNTNAVAEGVMAHALHLSKRLGPLTALVSSGKFDQRTKYPVGDLEGATLGILGYGRIGKRVALLASAFGMKVIVFDPFVEVPSEIATTSLDQLIATSDFITLHIPLTSESKGIISAERISLMRDGAILINCSRGGLIDLDASLAALKAGKISGIGLDVFDPEPPVHHPIFDHENVVLTPHVMGLSRKATIATFVDAARGVRDVLEARAPQAQVNLKQ